MSVFDLNMSRISKKVNFGFSCIPFSSLHLSKINKIKRIRNFCTKSVREGEIIESRFEATVKKQTEKKGDLDPGLYIVSTPLGNLGDISLRALRVLKNVEKIFTEDTRHSRKLLEYYDIRKNLESCHAHNEVYKSEIIAEAIEQHQAVALISDAGTPAVSDPGSKLISILVKRGIKIIPIPGPTAAMTALVASGLDTSSFTFIGFLPSKSGARKKKLKLFSTIPSTLILYVPPTDITEILQDCGTVLGNHKNCCIAREMTKIYESFYRGTIEEAIDFFGKGNEVIKGEITLLIEGNYEYQNLRDNITDEDIIFEIKEQLDAGDSVSVAAKKVAVSLGIGKSRVYKLALSLKNKE